MLDKGACLRYYKNSYVADLLLSFSKDREVSVRYGEAFGKRPDILRYPSDVLEFAKQNVTSFHVSEEHWHDPLMLSNTRGRAQLDKLRSGWDLILDVDCNHFEISKLCTHLIIEFLRFHKVKHIFVKFSGNKGFHVAIPWTSFPRVVGETLTSDMFPEYPRAIASFVSDHVYKALSDHLIKQHGLAGIREMVGDIFIEGGRIKVEDFIDIDTILLASRHLYRMPYSLHEKSGLISLPIPCDMVLKFERSMAHPEKFIAPLAGYLEPGDGDATELLRSSIDYVAKKPREIKKFKRSFEVKDPVPEDCFPPCIKSILQGINDGKKRALFAVTTFLAEVGWSSEMIESLVNEWNAKNPTPLRDAYVQGQLRAFNTSKRTPKCKNEGYYLALDVCKPDSLCRTIGTPSQYAVQRMRRKQA